MAELTTDEKFSIILQTLGKLEQSFDEMKADIQDLKAGQARLIQIQEKQDQILEILSHRSIEQEAEIKAIKRPAV